MTKAKPFIKWVGGKTQLIEQLDAQLPADFDKWENVTYIEPFVGGANLICKINAAYKFGLDNNKYLIALLNYCKNSPPQ